MSKKSKFASFLKNLFLLLFSLIVAVILSEIMVRLSVELETKRLAVYDDDLGWTGRPNGEEIYIRRKDNIRVKFRYNNYGFRDDDITVKEEPEKRILLLGDSFVESLEVEFNQVFHEILEKELQTNGSYDQIIVIGTQGYSTAQELLAYRRYKEIVQPDIVLLLFYTGNDFEDNLRRRFAYLDEKGELHMPKSKNSQVKIEYLKFKRWLYENSYLVFFTKNLIVSHLGIKIPAEGKEVKESSKTYAKEITKALIIELKNEIEKSNIPFGLVIFPSKLDLEEPSKVKFIMDLCKKNSIPFLSYHDILDSSSYFEYDVHFNKSGHIKVANEMSEFILRNF